MTDQFDPPTGQQPGPNGPFTESSWWDQEPSTRLQQRAGKPSSDPDTRLQRRPAGPDDPATRLQRRPGAPGAPPTRLQQPGGRRETGELGAVLGELSDRFEQVAGPDGTAQLGSGAEAE